MNDVSRPVLRYHGGKFGSCGSVADGIIAHFPPHRVYVEPFGGAASVLLRKPRAYAEVYNDLWDGVVTVFKTLRDRGPELEALLRLTPFARTEFERTDISELLAVDDPLELTRRIIFRSFAGFGSGAGNPAYDTGFRANSNRSHTTPAMDWQNYPDCVRFFVERLQGVVIENLDAAKVIRAHDGEDTLIFADPPYVHSTRSQKRRREREYVHEMDDQEHRALAEVLGAAEGMVLLAGYRCDLYDDLYGEWPRIEYEALADGARKRTECLWFNQAAWERHPMPRLPL